MGTHNVFRFRCLLNYFCCSFLHLLLLLVISYTNVSRLKSGKSILREKKSLRRKYLDYLEAFDLNPIINSVLFVFQRGFIKDQKLCSSFATKFINVLFIALMNKSLLVNGKIAKTEARRNVLAVRTDFLD